MERPRDDIPELDDRRAAALTSLADGVGGDAELRAEVAASPELTALVEEQRTAARAIRAAAGELRAPSGLRDRIEAERVRAAPRARRRRIGLTGGAVGAVAAVVLMLVLVLPGGTPGAPSISEAVALGALRATGPAPSVDAASPALLRASIGGIPFPNWGPKFAWRASGSRSDRVSGRSTRTIYYRGRNGSSIAYTIIDGRRLAWPAHWTQMNYEGQRFDTSLTKSGRIVLTWRRAGHTCVLSGRNVPLSVMLDLAAWKGAGHIPF